jgi:NADH-quinone oxidoreductase subunit L
VETTAWLVLALPLAGAILIAFLSQRAPVRLLGAIGTLAILGAFVSRSLTFLALQDREEEARQVVFVGWDYAAASASTRSSRSSSTR